MKIKINLNFLKPRLLNILLTLVVFSLPLLRERARLPEGGYEVAYYRPIYLLTSYLQMQEWYPLFLMVGLFLFIYFTISLTVLAITSAWNKLRESKMSNAVR